MWYTQTAPTWIFSSAIPSSEQRCAERVDGPGTKAANTLVGVVTAQCCQIHARDGAKEPCNLPIFFDGASRAERCGAALNGAGIYADTLHPIEVQRRAAIGLEGTASQGGDGADEPVMAWPWRSTISRRGGLSRLMRLLLEECQNGTELKERG